MALATMVVRSLHQAAVSWAVDDTLCRKRGLTLYGAGMHYDPLISSRAKPWSVGDTTGSCCARSSSPRSGHPRRCSPSRSASACTKTAKGSPRGRRPGENAAEGRSRRPSRSRPSHPARIGPGAHRPGGPAMVPRRRDPGDLADAGDSAYGGRAPVSSAPQRPPHQPGPPNGALYQLAPPRRPGQRGPARKKGGRLPGMAEWAADTKQPWTRLEFDQFGLHATLEVKTIRPCTTSRAGPAADHRAGAQRRREAPRPDVLLHPTRLDDATGPLGLRLSLGDRIHL